jgi:DHA1 family bicyclomycin/chloramphenicol resistance-like MFS transporter
MTRSTPTVSRPSLPAFPVFVAMMASLMALTALSIDIMLPAFPQIGAEFGLADPNAPQLVVTLYFIGFAVGQLFMGPLSDRFGRKAVLLAGLGVYAAASVVCLLSGSFAVLLAARFVQGAANASPRVISVAVVRDIYGGRRMAEVMSFVMMIFIIVPVIAPLIGAGILLAGGWHLIFLFLLAVSIAVFAWMALFLPETRPPEAREPLSVAWLVAAFTEVVRTRQTLGYTLATGAIFGGMMGYINSSQQIFTDVYDEGALFPVFFGLTAVSLAFAALLNSQMVGRFGMRRMSHAALVGYTAIGFLHAGIAWIWGPPPLALFIGLISITLFCFGLMMPNFNSIAMEPMGRIAGTASSFVGAVTTAVAVVLGLLVGQSFDGTVMPLLLGYAVFGLAALAIVFVVERGRLFGQGAA